ncbi:photosystem II protein PsbQ [Brasilonema sp. UFV-L1]|uniref:photosystem II protein PsbQ n=1 Tax=Brasilonema sp. UFV-L1 TaxID=2234130 RepID=UPI00145E1065|nr:photosystem II protein PsbQ [Brasilonema sp. UFV-L1]NMG07252.1 photosystem II protein PsbQ [Brasilonema sp. UFV-L1]
MARQRSILSFILVLLATFLISCGGPNVATPPPTYTQDQLVKIQEYVSDIQGVKERSQELERLIQTKQWVKVGNFIHGPMAEARLSMNYITSNLLPKDQPAGRELVRDLLDKLIKIGQATEIGNTNGALNNTVAAFTDIDKFLQLLPETSSPSEESEA